jgi:hypothetical protein
MTSSAKQREQIVSKFFSRKNLSHLAWYGQASTACKAATILQAEGILGSTFTLRDLVGASFEYISKNYKNEYVFKTYSLKRLVYGKYSPNTTAFYFEFPIGSARADSLLVNGHATVYEIKSEFDDFSRCDRQVSNYYSSFSRVAFMVADDLIERALKDLPSHVGVYSLNNRMRWSEIRPTRSFDGNINTRSMADIFRKDEFLDVYASEIGPLKSMEYHKIYTHCRNAISKLPPKRIELHLANALRKRQPASRLNGLCERLPLPLFAAAHEHRMRKADWESLISRMDSEYKPNT